MTYCGPSCDVFVTGQRELEGRLKEEETARTAAAAAHNDELIRLRRLTEEQVCEATATPICCRVAVGCSVVVPTMAVHLLPCRSMGEARCRFRVS